MDAQTKQLSSLQFFVTVEHPCSYLTGEKARNLVADPAEVDRSTYDQLAVLGFRRSGNHVYRPFCDACRACMSLRIPVALFQPNRSQIRTEIKNRDLQVRSMPCRFVSEHYRLFERYLRARHRNGGMDNTSPGDYLSFINADWSDTVLYEFRDEQQLLAVAVADRLHNGLSAVYTFFDPDAASRSLGTYAILWQIREAQRGNLSWVYLGYWIQHCKRMAYKANFSPCEVFRGGRWTIL